MPSKFYKVDTLPKLASGKADFKASKELALKLSEAVNQESESL
jgi:hypothetical protein